MGILTSVLTKVGLPIAVLAAAGAILFTFREPILQRVSAGSQTLGNIITAPFVGILEGINEGFQNVPDFLTFKFPEFKFAFGDDSTTTQLVNGAVTVETEKAPAGFVPPPPDPNATGNCSIKQFADGSIVDTCNPANNRDATPPPSPPPPPSIIPQAFGAEFTPFNVGRTFRVGLGGKNAADEDDFTKFKRFEILANNPNAIGLFDLGFTERLDFQPLSAAAVKFFQQKGIDVQLSGQLFKEIGNVDDIV